MQITIGQLKPLLLDTFKANLTPLVTSSPGIGKSSIYKQIADMYKLKLIDIRLSQADPSDLNGFPVINEEKTKSGYVPMNTFPIEGDPIPEGYDGWLLLFDEFNSAAQSVIAAAYKIVLDREIGQFKLHPNVAIGCAGNLMTDKAIVNKIGTAMQSRLIHFEVRIDAPSWITWAEDNNIDHRVTAYIRFKEENLHKFDPNHNDKTFATPRTWEFTSKLIKDMEEIPLDKLPLLAGTIGEGIAREFLAYTQIYQDLPSLHDLINKGDTIKVPTEPSVLYAITGFLGSNINKDNVEQLMVFINRLPKEFQVITLKGAIRKDVSIYSQGTAIREWADEMSEYLK